MIHNGLCTSFILTNQHKTHLEGKANRKHKLYTCKWCPTLFGASLMTAELLAVGFGLWCERSNSKKANYRQPDRSHTVINHFTEWLTLVGELVPRVFLFIYLFIFSWNHETDWHYICINIQQSEIEQESKQTNKPKDQPPHASACQEKFCSAPH